MLDRFPDRRDEITVAYGRTGGVSTSTLKDEKRKTRSKTYEHFWPSGKKSMYRAQLVSIKEDKTVLLESINAYDSYILAWAEALGWDDVSLLHEGHVKHFWIDEV